MLGMSRSDPAMSAMANSACCRRSDCASWCTELRRRRALSSSARRLPAASSSGSQRGDAKARLGPAPPSSGSNTATAPASSHSTRPPQAGVTPARTAASTDSAASQASSGSPRPSSGGWQVISRGQSDEHTSRQAPWPSSPRITASAMASTLRASSRSMTTASAGDGDALRGSRALTCTGLTSVALAAVGDFTGRAPAGGCMHPIGRARRIWRVRPHPGAPCMPASGPQEATALEWRGEFSRPRDHPGPRRHDLADRAGDRACRGRAGRVAARARAAHGAALAGVGLARTARAHGRRAARPVARLHPAASPGAGTDVPRGRRRRGAGGSGVRRVLRRALTVEHYPDSVEALERMAARVPLAALSNGNAACARIGLMHLFEFQLGAREHGVAKPDASIFHAACARLACTPADGAARGRRHRDGRGRRAPRRPAQLLDQPRRARLAAPAARARPASSPPLPTWPTGWRRHAPRTRIDHDRPHDRCPPASSAPPMRPTPCRCTWWTARRWRRGAARSRRPCAAWVQAQGFDGSPGTADDCWPTATAAWPARWSASAIRSTRPATVTRRWRCPRATGAVTGRHRRRTAPGTAAGLGPGRVPLRPLQDSRARTPARLAVDAVDGDARRHAGRLRARARPGQHADRAHGPGPAGSRSRCEIAERARRDDQSDRRRRPAGAELPRDPRRRPRLRIARRG